MKKLYLLHHISFKILNIYSLGIPSQPDWHLTGPSL